MDKELEQKHAILREAYMWYGVLYATNGNDPEKDASNRGYENFADQYINRSTLKTVEDFRGWLDEMRMMARKRLAGFKNEPVRLSWPTAGTTVWASFSSLTKVVLCKTCKGEPYIEHEGGKYRCETCHGQGSSNEREVKAVEVIVVRAEYSQSGGAVGWGEEVHDLINGGLTLWYVNENGTKYTSEDIHRNNVFQTKEDCERGMASKYAKDCRPRWRQS